MESGSQGGQLDDVRPHTFASHAVMQGMPLPVVALWRDDQDDSLMLIVAPHRPPSRSQSRHCATLAREAARLRLPLGGSTSRSLSIDRARRCIPAASACRFVRVGRRAAEGRAPVGRTSASSPLARVCCSVDCGGIRQCRGVAVMTPLMSAASNNATPQALSSSVVASVKRARTVSGTSPNRRSICLRSSSAIRAATSPSH